MERVGADTHVGWQQRATSARRPQPRWPKISSIADGHARNSPVPARPKIARSTVFQPVDLAPFLAVPPALNDRGADCLIVDDQRPHKLTTPGTPQGLEPSRDWFPSCIMTFQQSLKAIGKMMNRFKPSTFSLKGWIRFRGVCQAAFRCLDLIQAAQPNVRTAVESRQPQPRPM